MIQNDSFLTNISEFASIITAILMALTTLFLTIKSIRNWIANFLANNVKTSKLSKDSDLYKELLKNTEYENTFKDIETSLLRLEILHYLNFNPDDKETIYMLFDKYKNTGGNSYMCDIIKQWEKNEYKNISYKIHSELKKHQENCPVVKKQNKQTKS